MTRVGNTRDHYVPQMYLKRFARPTSNGHQLTVTTRDLDRRFKASVRDVAVEAGFYWGTDPHGVPHHDMEEFLSVIEGAGARAFRSMLDSRRHRTTTRSRCGHLPRTSVSLQLGGSPRRSFAQFASGRDW
jgi:hypothetical protein